MHSFLSFKILFQYNTYYVNSDVSQQHRESPQVFNYHTNQLQNLKEVKEHVTRQQQNCYVELPESFQSNVANSLQMKESFDINSVRKKFYELT